MKKGTLSKGTVMNLVLDTLALQCVWDEIVLVVSGKEQRGMRGHHVVLHTFTHIFVHLGVFCILL